MQISPYSADISLKKLLTKDQPSLVFHPNPGISLVKKWTLLIRKMILSSTNLELTNDSTEAYKKIENSKKGREKDLKGHESEMLKIQNVQ